MSHPATFFNYQETWNLANTVVNLSQSQSARLGPRGNNFARMQIPGGQQ